MRTAAAFLAALAFAAPLAAAPAKTPAADPKSSADAFNLDLGASESPAPAETSPASDAAATHYSLDTPIAELLANYRSKAVLDKDMPGLSTDKNLDKLKPLSLNRLAPLSGGRLTPELLAKVAKDLAKID